jgi:hypothetical protein
MTKTIVALYDDFDTAQNAVQDLVDGGFLRENISVVANDVSGVYRDRYVDHTLDVDDEDDVSAGEGAGFGAVVGALVGLGVALIPGIGPVLAAGPLAAALMAGVGAVAGAATGGVVAGLVDFGVPEEEAEVYAEGIRRGGTLVSVTADDDYAARVQDILNRHNPADMDERSTTWREGGWSDFDHEAEPYTSEQMSDMRKLYRGAEGDIAARTGTTTGLPDTTGYESDEYRRRNVRVYGSDE